MISDSRPATQTIRSLSALPGPPKLPFLGNLLQLEKEKVHIQLEGWAHRYGELYAVWLGSRPLLIVSSTDLVHKILRDRPTGYRRARLLREAILDLGATGVFTAEGEDWSRQRRMMMAAFDGNHMRASHDQIIKVTRRLEERWRRTAERREVIDVISDLMSYTVDVTSLVAFGHDMNTLGRAAGSLQRAMATISASLQRRDNAPFPYWRYVKLPADYALDRAVAEFRETVLKLIRRAEAELASDPARSAAPRNLLESMIIARDRAEPGLRLSDAELFGNVFTVLLGGEATTACTLAWMLYAMARYPVVHDRMREEAERTLEADLPLTAESAQKLPYISGVIQETLRLKSAGPLLYLESASDMIIGDVAVPEGTQVVVLTRHESLKPDNFGDPTSFDPARWTNAGASHGRHEPRAVLPFGAGPRACPGRSLALAECTMVGVMVARRFNISLVDHIDAIEERFAFAMGPKKLRLRFAPADP